MVDEAPDGFAPRDLPAQPAVFAPDFAPEEIAVIAARLRKQAGLSANPTRGASTEKPKTRPTSKTQTKRPARSTTRARTAAK